MESTTNPVEILVVDGTKIQKFKISTHTSLRLVQLLSKLERNPLHDFNFAPFVPFPKDPQQRVAIAFRRLRRRNSLTQSQMAKKLGVSQGDICNYENARKPIGKKVAKKIQNLFGVDYYKLLA